jgi:hypothetical protein
VQEWAQQQWAKVDLGDRRLNRRAVEMGARMAAHPEDSLPNQMQSWAALNAAYRLLNHPGVSMSKLLEPHLQQTLGQARAAPVVLWVEDTTELDFTPHPHTQGLGPIGDGKGRGLLLHSTLGVIPGSRRIVGLGSVQVVLRQPKAKKHTHWTRSPEAQLWEQSAQQVGRPPHGAIWVHVSDSGSDSFEYMAACRQNQKHFLVRVFHNRRLSWEADLPQAQQAEARKLLDYARSLPFDPASQYSVAVQATPKHPAREAQVQLAWGALTIPVPTQAPDAVQAYAPLAAWVVRAYEPQPPDGEEALEWILVTSLPVQSLADAQEKVSWYTHRWLCEDFHQCLKTGCRLEATQLDHADDIQTLLGFAAPLAVHLLQLRQEARLAPETPAVQVVDPLQVKLLVRVLALKIEVQALSLDQFWRYVAQLGGHLGRKGDGPPGWRTLWRGWRYLSDLTLGAQLLQDSS